MLTTHYSLLKSPAADTVVLTHPPPGLSSPPRVVDELPPPQDILEKPTDKEDNLRMLLDLNGGVCEVVTGVSVGAYPPLPPLLLSYSPPGSFRSMGCECTD